MSLRRWRFRRLDGQTAGLTHTAVRSVTLNGLSVRSWSPQQRINQVGESLLLPTGRAVCAPSPNQTMEFLSPAPRQISLQRTTWAAADSRATHSAVMHPSNRQQKAPNDNIFHFAVCAQIVDSPPPPVCRYHALSSLFHFNTNTKRLPHSQKKNKR